MDIVLQGKYDKDTNEIILAYLDLPFVNDIIVSCWDDNRILDIYDTTGRVKMIRSAYPASPGTDNRNLQIISSLEGLRATTTPFVAKMRSDQCYTKESMMVMYEYFMGNYKPQTIFVAGTYPNLLFHPRDHIFWGARADVTSLFAIPLELNGIQERLNLDKSQLFHHYHEFIRSETYIGAHYLGHFSKEMATYLAEPAKYLYDKAPMWNTAKETSDTITHKYFKPFPRNGIDLKWTRKGWDRYPYTDQKNTGECWAEDFRELDANILNQTLADFAKDPENDELNYKLAMIYLSLDQTAAAISYFLRAAERTKIDALSYECLLKIGLCFEKQGKRNNTVRGVYEQAMCLIPLRPEAYFLLSRFYERTGDHVNGYLYAELGLKFAMSNHLDLRSDVEYPGKYGLIFEKAVCAWWWGKPNECRALLHKLKYEYKMDDIHRNAVENNLMRTRKL
jgi:tetratricopeptide (TPR) repeat protein